MTKNFNAIKYLKSRGLSEDTAALFDLGFSSSNVTEDLLKFGYTPDDLLSSGLTNSIGKNTFYNSITIPLKNISGDVTSITSRSLGNSKLKYINLPKTKIQDFFGADFIKQRFKYKYHDRKYVFICEGQFDTMILHEHNLFALGILGVNNMREAMFEHLKLFDSVILCFDNDTPGHNAANQFAKYVKYYAPTIKLHKVHLYDHINDVSDFFVKEKQTVKDLFKLIRPFKCMKGQPFRKKSMAKHKKSASLSDIESLDIVQFIKEVLKTSDLRESGGNFKMICPFPDHIEKIGSFTVYPDTNSFYCFGCGKSGSIVSLVSGLKNITARDSIILLRKWSKI